MTAEEYAYAKRTNSRNYYTQRVTPDSITSLESNQVYVYITRPDDNAPQSPQEQTAMQFGAKPKHTEGQLGQTYAIHFTRSDIHETEMAIKRFVEYARANPKQQFLVTEVGTPDEVNILFKYCIEVENISLPRSIWYSFGIRM